MSYLGATADLLQVARGTLRERVMAKVDGEARYEAAMVANAMAIAVRELELGPAARAEERELLAGFYGTAGGDPGGAAPPAVPRPARRSDRAERELRQLLERLVHARLQISNPAYLATRPACAYGCFGAEKCLH